MAANKIVLLPTIVVPTSIGNLYSPGTTTGGTNNPSTIANLAYIIRKIRVVNTTAAQIFIALWKQVTIGSTPVAGKEIIWGGTATLLVLDAGKGVAVPANGFLESTDILRLDASETDKFLVGGASASGLTISAETEVTIA
jgi:hypothetical protein